jgi:hypothetical protein
MPDITLGQAVRLNGDLSKLLTTGQAAAATAKSAAAQAVDVSATAVQANIDAQDARDDAQAHAAAAAASAEQIGPSVDAALADIFVTALIFG